MAKSNEQIIRYRHLYQTFDTAEEAFENFNTTLEDNKFEQKRVFKEYLESGKATQKLLLDNSNGCQTLIQTRTFETEEILEELKSKRDRSNLMFRAVTEIFNDWEIDISKAVINFSNYYLFTENFLDKVFPDSTTNQYVRSANSDKFKNSLDNFLIKIADKPPTNLPDNKDEDSFKGVFTEKFSEDDLETEPLLALKKHIDKIYDTF